MMPASDSTPNNTVIAENITKWKITLMESSEETPIMVPIGVRIPIITVISLAIVFSNVINISILWRTSQIPAMAKIFLTNLSSADLMVGLFACIPSIWTAAIGQWPYGVAWCQISACVHVISASTSIWSLAFVSIDRYIAIKRPLHYRQMMTRIRCTIMVLLAWLLTSIYAMIPLFLRIPEFVYYQFTPAEVLCDFIFEYRWWSLCNIIAIPSPPAILLICTTVSIIRTTRASLNFVQSAKRKSVGQCVTTSTCDPGKHTEKTQGYVHRKRRVNNNNNNNNNKAVKILILTTAMYFLAWGPFVLKVIMYSVVNNFHFPIWMEFTFMWIANTNSCMNVFIYSFIYASFRKRAKHLIVSLALCRLRNLKRFEQLAKAEEAGNK